MTEGPVIDLPAPCPFCDGTRGVVGQVERFGTPPPDADPSDGWWDFYVRCTSCSCEGPPTKTSAESALRKLALRPTTVDGRPNLRPYGTIPT